ncbi:MAG: 2-amino-4-hydroxy-6-hydroxymethyldihydropteridine diphosphokinase [Clostridiales bacterium]|jgi:dihydroneopterin aldolase/2-amino-4-hydroxy-6-hydroxymethyldihydropteridine diphosphokinase|nr:2-amino-4-hydroxy-6-hydroxymethyldihydropteridine diphosphokinase [Clostridiales bacterium]
MSNEITINKLFVYGYHGCRDHEREIGQSYRVTCKILQRDRLYRSDSVNETLSYSLLARDIHRTVREGSYKIVESCAKSIMTVLFTKYSLIDEIWLDVEKAATGAREMIIDSVVMSSHRKWNLVYLSLGSNMGDREKNLNTAIDILKENLMIRDVRVSSYYDTKPVGPVEQADFLNCVVELRTFMSAMETLETVLQIEKDMGRVREIPKGPRNIDLDILFFGNEVINGNIDLVIPHPRVQKRMFMLEPLCELNEEFIHPVLKKHVIDLKDALSLSLSLKKESN